MARDADRGSPERVPLERLLSKWRVASRTQAQALVRAGRVTVDGRTVRDPRRWVVPGRQALALDGRRLEAPGGAGGAEGAGRTVYLALNKPRGVLVTTRDPEGRPTVMGLVAAHAVPGLAPVGRLDQASAGLLLLTDDHDLAARLLDPFSHVAKAYRVKVRGHVAPEALEALRHDTLEEDGLRLGPMQVEVESVGPRSTWLRVTLNEGKNRQIRRRLVALGHAVEVLVRTRFGPLALGDLAAGSVRTLSDVEVAALRRAAGAGSTGPGKPTGPGK